MTREEEEVCTIKGLIKNLHGTNHKARKKIESKFAKMQLETV